MGAILNISDLNLRYRVFHADFDSEKTYLAIAYIDYGESAWSQLLFVNERGMTFALSVKHTVCVTEVVTNGCNGRLWQGLGDKERKAPPVSRA